MGLRERLFGKKEELLEKLSVEDQTLRVAEGLRSDIQKFAKARNLPWWMIASKLQGTLQNYSVLCEDQGHNAATRVILSVMEELYARTVVSKGSTDYTDEIKELIKYIEYQSEVMRFSTQHGYIMPPSVAQYAVPRPGTIVASKTTQATAQVKIETRK